MNFGETLKQARINAGLTQKQLGEKCGMADSAIRKYESGKVKPKIETLQKIARALGCNVNDLDNSLSNILVDAVFPSNLKDDLSSVAKNMMISLYGTDDEWEARKSVFIQWVNGLDEVDKRSVFDIIKYLQKLNSDGKITAAERVEELTQISKYKYRDTE